MDPESVKAIVEALSGLGEDAKGAFVWYVVCEMLPKLFTPIVICFVFLMGFRCISKCIKWCLGLGEIEKIVGGNAWTKKEWRDVLVCLEEHYDEYREKNK